MVDALDQAENPIGMTEDVPGPQHFKRHTGLREAKGHPSQRNEMAQQSMAWASPETMACVNGT